MIKWKEIVLFISLSGIFAFIGSAQTTYTFEGDQSNLSYETLFNNGTYDDVTIDGNFTLDIKQDATLNIEKDKSFTVNENWIISCNTNLKIGEEGIGSAYVTVGGGFQSIKSVSLFESSTLTIGSEANASTSIISMGSKLEILGTSIVEIWGDVNTGSQFNVAEGAMLIIHGDLTMTGSSNNDFYGTVIVTGDVDMVKCTITATGNFVVGGDFIMDKIESITGPIYSIDGGTVKVGKDDATATDYGDDKNFSDLEEAAKTDPAAADLIEKLKDYGIISDGGQTVDRLWTGGGKSNLWTDIYNWSPNKLPDENSDIKIPAGKSYYPVITGTITMINLEIASGATVTLNAGADVSIAGNLTTNGGLIINNTQDSPVSVKIDGESDGYATETWKLDNDRWWYIGHSVYNDNTNLFNYYYNSVGSPAGNDFRLYYWDASNQGWSRITSSLYSYNPVEGYAFMQQYNKDGLSYQGEFNNDDDYVYKTIKEGWHHLANPYPCYIDISQASLVNFTGGYKIYTTDTNGDRVYQGAYWGSGEVLIGMSGGTNYIAPGQGFWMYTETDGSESSVKISKSACVTKATAESGGGSVSLKSTSSATHNYLKMSLTNEVSNGEMYLLFNENGSDSFTRYDFKKKFVGGNVADMYMVKDDEYVDINVLPTITSSVIVPVGYKVSASGMTEMTINTSDVSFIDEVYDVFLDDLQEPSVSINLRKQSSYTFTPEVAQTDGRFQLRIVPSMTTGIDDEEDVVSDESVSVYTLKQTATVKVTDEVLYQKDGVIEVYDISGQLVKQLELTDVETIFSLPQANTIYIISVKAGNSSYQQKVVTQ